MPSKLRKAIGAVKDQTSISLAKVTNAANLEVIILKATTHDKNPIEERYVNEIVQLVSSNKLYAAACAQSIGKRIGKTRNWVVALKSLMIVLRIFRDGDPYFPREVFHAMKRGARILNLSSFRDDSNSSPWDYTAFVRTFALYLDERLDCFLTGKLQRRFTYHNRSVEKNQMNSKISNDQPGIKDMKPTMILDRITHWQKLLDRAIGTRPSGSARTNRLVQISVYAIVQESFDLYKDISDGLAVLLDSFFNLPHAACVEAFKALVKSYKQFDELSTFYSFCVGIGIGRSYEFPKVERVSEELMETLQEFLKDQASFPANNGSKQNLLTGTKHHAGSSSSQDEGSERHGAFERFFESGSEFGSQSTSLEDLMSATDAAMSPRRSLEQNMYSEHSDEDEDDDDEKKSQYDDFASATDFGSIRSFAVNQASRSSMDIMVFDDDLQQQVQENKTNEWQKQNAKTGSSNGSKDCWELVLAKTVSPKVANGFDPFVTLFDQPSVSQNQYNPFLEETGPIAPSITTDHIPQSQSTFNDGFGVATMFNSTSPTFLAQDDPAPTFTNQTSDSTTNLDLIFGGIDPNKVTTAPIFRAQNSTETTMLVPQNVHNKASPSFQGQCSFENGLVPNFQAHNSRDPRIAPTFSVQNFDPTPAILNHNNAQNPNMSIVPVTFQAQNFHPSIMAPTFSAKDSYGTTLATEKDDLFGPWSNGKVNERVSNLPNQEQTLWQQQQMWLEQQNKIIAKYMA